MSMSGSILTTIRTSIQPTPFYRILQGKYNLSVICTFFLKFEITGHDEQKLVVSSQLTSMSKQQLSTFIFIQKCTFFLRNSISIIKLVVTLCGSENMNRKCMYKNLLTLIYRSEYSFISLNA